MPNVLSIEDDEMVINEVIGVLSMPRYHVEVARTGRDGIAKVMSRDYDVVTLDRVLPDLDGLTIVAAMRNAGIDTPVLLVSSMSDVDERVRGLRAGGDDYLAKPFSPDEMLARVEVLLRRKPLSHAAETSLHVGALELNLIKRCARFEGQEFDLQPTEYRVLEFMMRHPGQVLTRTMIFEAVWGGRFDPGTNLIDVHIGRLRKKLDGLASQPLIRTVRGSGYRLC
ncbi:response regulator transcription factor [Caballeronia glathei]|jgi:DNA-binding response OmpR family regulator|uniref:Transcriptional regulator n=1 Tax=Caballeronia glathei TaxID=60547 RepID=A0A069PQP0_9BURK|nr:MULTISPECIES: response regulator transcription factor [Burkholderiaceae]KDR42742.1 transcriptional regulator [Caballeronia glathei]TCK36993.1 winged helix family two component transcriptional regulator [Paraburkholderia sp. BL8N3]